MEIEWELNFNNPKLRMFIFMVWARLSSAVTLESVCLKRLNTTRTIHQCYVNRLDFIGSCVVLSFSWNSYIGRAEISLSLNCKLFKMLSIARHVLLTRQMPIQRGQRIYSKVEVGENISVEIFDQSTNYKWFAQLRLHAN